MQPTHIHGAGVTASNLLARSSLSSLGTIFETNHINFSLNAGLFNVAPTQRPFLLSLSVYWSKFQIDDLSDFIGQMIPGSDDPNRTSESREAVMNGRMEISALWAH